MDSGDKAANKAMSVAHKYAFLQVLAIPTKETKDPDHESYEIKPKSPNNVQPIAPTIAPPPIKIFHSKNDGQLDWLKKTLKEHRNPVVPETMWQAIIDSLEGKDFRELPGLINMGTGGKADGKFEEIF